MNGFRSPHGFTLLEVMIAVAILGLSLTAIFSSEVGAVQAVNRSRNMDTATLLARCKMGELEELVAQEGLPAIEKKGQDACCEHAEREGFECEWIIDRVVLPDFGEDFEDGEEEYADDIEEVQDDPLAAIQDEVGTGEDLISGGVGDSFTVLAMQLGYPVLKPSIEEQVRRATITIRWMEGKAERSFDVMQFMVADQPIPADEPTEEEDGDTSSTTPASGDTGAGTTRSNDTGATR